MIDDNSHDNNQINPTTTISNVNAMMARYHNRPLSLTQWTRSWARSYTGSTSAKGTTLMSLIYTPVYIHPIASIFSANSITFRGINAYPN
jgi:hypothetical protein